MNEAPFNPNTALTIQLLEWIVSEPRTYAETLDAWRTSCPRLSIWEDALAAGLIDTDQSPARILLLSPGGSELLLSHSRESNSRKATPKF
ncbi:MAG TPA: hypothetical protein VIK52_14905 [Opitutaceae bacterium]